MQQAAAVRRRRMAAAVSSRIPSLICLNGKVPKHPKTKQRTVPSRKRGGEKFWRKVSAWWRNSIDKKRSPVSIKRTSSSGNWGRAGPRRGRWRGRGPSPATWGTQLTTTAATRRGTGTRPARPPTPPPPSPAPPTLASRRYLARDTTTPSTRWGVSSNKGSRRFHNHGKIPY